MRTKENRSESTPREAGKEPGPMVQEDCLRRQMMTFRRTKLIETGAFMFSSLSDFGRLFQPRPVNHQRHAPSDSRPAGSVEPDAHHCFIVLFSSQSLPATLSENQ